MIGNDIVDLALAKKESNWNRKGFLEKIFTKEEQLLISTSKNPDSMVWNLWSRKEAAYKIYNRETGIRGYFPLKLICKYTNEKSGYVTCNGRKYFTKTTITNDKIHTIAVVEYSYFNKIKQIEQGIKIYKKNGIPFIKTHNDSISRPVSISHHGDFWEGIFI